MDFDTRQFCLLTLRYQHIIVLYTGENNTKH